MGLLISVASILVFWVLCSAAWAEVKAVFRRKD